MSLALIIPSTLKQGEVRNVKVTVENIGNADAKNVKVDVTSPSLGINAQKSYDNVPSEEARTIAFEIDAKKAGKFKISGIVEYWDDEGNKYIETVEKTITIEPLPVLEETHEKQPVKEPEKSVPGFEIILALLVFLLTSLVLKKNKR